MVRGNLSSVGPKEHFAGPSTGEPVPQKPPLERSSAKIALQIQYNLIGIAAYALVAGFGHFLQQLKVNVNPLVWAGAQIISALLCMTIAANVLVRFHGTGNRMSLLLGCR